MKKKEFVSSFEGASDKTLKKRKREGFLKKLKNKIDEFFESENLTFNGKVLMLTIYGMVSSIGLIAASTIGNVALKIIWAFANLSSIKCPSFGAIVGISWVVFILSFLSFIALMIYNEYIGITKADNESEMPELLTSIFEKAEKEQEVF